MANIAPLTKRLVKGSPLTSQEGDNNWTIIENYVNALATNQGVSLNDDGTLKRPLVVRGASTNGTHDYACTVPGAYATAADLIGLWIVIHVDTMFTPVDANDSPTLTLNGTIGPLNIKKLVNVQVGRGDIRVNQEIILTYDGTNLILHNPASNSRANYGATTGTNTYLLDIANLSANTFELPQNWYDGYRLSFKLGTSFTAISPTPTLAITVASVTVLAAKTIMKMTAAGKDSLRELDMTAGNIYDVVYDGTDLLLLNPNADPVIHRVTPQVIPSTGGPIAGLTNVAHGLGGRPDGYQISLYCNVSRAATGSYAIGDVIPLSGVVARNSAGSVIPWAVLVDDLAGATFSVIKTAQGATALTFTDLLMLTKATGAVMAAVSHADFVADFSIQATCWRYKRAK